MNVVPLPDHRNEPLHGAVRDDLLWLATGCRGGVLPVMVWAWHAVEIVHRDGARKVDPA
jgi:hypothetical protein